MKNKTEVFNWERFLTIKPPVEQLRYATNSRIFEIEYILGINAI